jgi:hypothetical protein
MLAFDPLPLAGVAVGCLVVTLAALRLRQRLRQPSGKAAASPSQARPEGIELLSRYHPSAVRVLSNSERQAFDLVRAAMPNHIVMAQVPLVRYLRVQDKRVEEDWLRGLSMLSADILVCDTHSRPLFAVDILPPKLGSRAQDRHDRMRQLLEGVGVRVLVWHEGRLPAGDQVQAMLRKAAADSSPDSALAAGKRAAAPTAAAAAGATAPAPRKPASDSARASAARAGAAHSPERLTPPLMPEQADTAPGARAAGSTRPNALASLIPAPEISELLAEGDEIAARHPSMDPVSLTFFDEFEPRSQPHSVYPH